MSLSTQEYTWVPVNCQGSVMKWMGGGEGGERLQDRLLLNGPHYLKTDLDNRGRICKQCLIVDLWIEVCSTQYWLGSIFLSWTLQTPDFYVEMKWEFTSWGKNFFIAVFSCTVTKSYFDLECLSVKKLCSAAKLHYTNTCKCSVIFNNYLAEIQILLSCSERTKLLLKQWFSW